MRWLSIDRSGQLEYTDDMSGKYKLAVTAGITVLSVSILAVTSSGSGLAPKSSITTTASSDTSQASVSLTDETPATTVPTTDPVAQPAPDQTSSGTIAQEPETPPPITVVSTYTCMVSRQTGPDSSSADAYLITTYSDGSMTVNKGQLNINIFGSSTPTCPNNQIPQAQ